MDLKRLRLYNLNMRILASIIVIALLAWPRMIYAGEQLTQPQFKIMNVDITHDDTGIAVKANIQTQCIGPYSLKVELFSADDVFITSQPYYEYASAINHPSLNFVTAQLDQQHNIDFRFSGEAIRRGGIDGPYKIKLYNWPFPELSCAEHIQPMQALWFNTPPYHANDFNEACSSGETARPCKDIYE